MRHTILLFLFICCLGSADICGQTNERVYVQTDKQLYLSGELLWLKLYTTDAAGRLLDCSKIGYVELIHDSIPEVQIKVDIQQGIGAGWIELPALLPTGYYRMVAYTRFMRNEGEHVYFEKTIAVVNPFHPNNELYADATNRSFTYAPVENSNPALIVTSDKSTYSRRNKGEVRIKGLPAERISLGISIAGSDPLLAEPATIDTWKQQLTANKASVGNGRYLPEYEGAIVDGVLVDLETGNPATAQVIPLLSFPGKELQVFAGQISASGDVTFYTQCVTGKREVATTVIASSDKKYRVDIQPPYTLHKPVNLPVFSPDSTWKNYLRSRYLSTQVAQIYTADSLSKIKELAACSNIRPQTRYILDDWKRFPTMEEVFVEFIAYGRIRRTNEGRRFMMFNQIDNTNNTNILVLLDNIPVADHELMVNYNPLLLKTIDMHFSNFMIGMHRFEGIIACYTYKNDYPGITFGANTQIFNYEGTQPYRYFFTPKYDGTSTSTPLPDFRHTLLWEPDVQTNGQNELIIPFTTSDLSGSYVITIEGIGENGAIIQAKHAFRVE